MTTGAARADMIHDWPQLREFALSLGLPEVTLAHPWGHEALKAHFDEHGIAELTMAVATSNASLPGATGRLSGQVLGNVKAMAPRPLRSVIVLA